MKMYPTIRVDGTPIMIFVTPCCGYKQYDFPEERPRTCLGCGKVVENEPVEQERDLSHLLNGGPATRYFS